MTKWMYAFTLIELLVVISIIALLIALLLPALGLSKEITRRAVCASGVRQMSVGVHVYSEDNRGEMPGPSGYEPRTANYFQPGPGGPTSNGTGDFSGLYPNYVGAPELFYCPSGPWRPDSPWGDDVAFYGYFPWHNFASKFPSGEMWGRYITYDYLGRLGMDWVGRNPPKDINGNDVEFARSTSDDSNIVLVTDYNTYSDVEDAYSFTNHPASVSDMLNPRNGLNVGHLDGSVIWKDERDTVASYQWRPGAWKKF
mgnify:CR=1 FL=1